MTEKVVGIVPGSNIDFNVHLCYTIKVWVKYNKYILLHKKDNYSKIGNN